MEPVVLTPKRHTRLGIALIALVVLLVSACGPVHIDPRWSSISVLDEDTIVLAFGDRLTLVNAIDGTPVSLRDGNGNVRLDENGNPRLWEIRGPDGAQTRFYNTPVMTSDETLLAPSYDMRLLEVDVPVARLDGAGVALEQHVVSSPVLGENYVYQGLADRNLVALNRDDLSTAWTVETAHGVWSSPILVDDVLYFSSMDHSLYAVNAQTGDLIWQADLGGAMTSSPTYTDGHLYIGTFGKRVVDVDAETGQILSEAPTSDWVWSTPALVDGTLYVTDVGGHVYAFNTDGGLTEQWTVKAATRSIASTALVTDENVIVGSRDQNVYWLDRDTGEVVDTKATAGEVMANPILLQPSEGNNLVEPLVVVGTTAPQEMLVAFTLERGQRVWAYGR